jgi:hypothetical protein
VLIKEKTLQHWIDHFYGYGSWEANVWFIGYEEPGGDLPEEVAEKLDYFLDAHSNATGPTLCDLRELYKRAGFRTDGPRSERFNTLFDYRFGPDAIINGVWKNLVGFACGFNDSQAPDPLEYQRQSFASLTTRKEASIQLMPLPSPHAHAWYYAWLDLPQSSFLRSRRKYEETVYPSRINAILSNIVTYKPAVVLMYGLENIIEIKASVASFFPGTKFKSIKAIKLQMPQHHWADVGSTRLVMTTQMPALKHNRIETGFDWREFGRRVAGY